MKRARWGRAAALIAFVPSLLGHPAILPAPRHLSEGSGRFPLAGASICFAAKPSPEDRFAARELASDLAASLRITLPVVETGCGTRSIVFSRTGQGGDLAAPGETAGEASREAYSIRISPSAVRLESRSSAGLFYAVQTLRQMVETAGEPALPEATVTDWPALPYRGLMMDMSHTQLPRLDELKRQIDFLAFWKVNQYFFYSEATIALDGYPILPPHAQFSKAQVRELIDYARARHIDVIPNPELYGHLHDVFRKERYADLAPIRYGGEFRPEDPRVPRILEDWISQLAALFPSKFFHIGFDETWLLEKGAEQLHKSPEDLYLEQLRRVVGLVQKNGKVPLAWADMMEKYPRMIPQLPQGLIAVPWHYEPLTDAEYQRFLKPFHEAGVPMMVLSAVLNWQWLVPNYTTSFEVDKRLLEAGLKYGASGFLNSEWTDDTQAALLRMARPALAHSSIAAWQGAAPPAADFFRQYAAAIYPEGVAAPVARALEQLDRAEVLLEKAQGRTISAFWDNPFSPARLKRSQEHGEELHQSRLAAEEAEELLEGIRDDVDAPTIHALLVGSRLLNYAALKYIYANQIAGFWKELGDHPTKHDVTTLIALETADHYHSRTADMMDAIGELRDEYRAAWLEEYTPFRLSVGLGKYDAEFQFWWRFQRKVQALCSGFRDGNQFPPLESVLGDQ
jgi:hexosaminidase